MNTRIHIHTKYSLLDAIIEPEQLIKHMAERGEKALCVTEHGNVYSNVEVYKLCKKYGIQYMYGCEMYICDDVKIRDSSSKYNHLIVIAKNETGRINLNKLVSLSCYYKYYGKPRIDFNMLTDHKDGLIIVSACMAGAVCGDHCSPISDTTIMASAGAQCNHVNHVSTQLPYAITVAAITFVMFILAGFIRSALICLPIGIALTIGTLFVIKLFTNKKKSA